MMMNKINDQFNKFEFNKDFEYLMIMIDDLY